MKTKKILNISAVFGVLCIVAFSVSHYVGAQEMSSANYKVLEQSINVGGTDTSGSASYRLSDTIGESGVGTTASSDYTLSAGYRQLLGSSISLSASPDISMAPTLQTSGGGVSSGEGSWVVTTDSPGGYALYIKSSTNPAMRASIGGSTIDDYSPSEPSAPDFAFTVAPTAAGFGFSPEGDDIVSAYKDNGAVCASGSLDTANACWDSLSVGDKTISLGVSNQPLGAITTVKFKIENGTSHVLDSGVYQATITITAISL